MPTFPANRLPGKDQSAIIYTDSGLMKKAAIVSLSSGKPYPNSQIDVGTDGLWPLFTAAVAPVYYRNSSGQTVMFSATIADAASVSVTGAKSTGAAVTSLIAALVAVGVPISDQTT